MTPSIQEVHIGFLKDRCLLRLSPRFTAGTALRITPRRQDELWCCAADSRREKCSYVLIFVHPKLKNALFWEPIIQIKFRLHRCVSYDKIFKTRPHLIIFILYFFLKHFYFIQEHFLSWRNFYLVSKHFIGAGTICISRIFLTPTDLCNGTMVVAHAMSRHPSRRKPRQTSRLRASGS